MAAALFPRRTRPLAVTGIKIDLTHEDLDNPGYEGLLEEITPSGAAQTGVLALFSLSWARIPPVPSAAAAPDSSASGLLCSNAP